MNLYSQPSSIEPVTILLVDDDDVDAMGIERAIAKLQIDNPLVRARDGVEALEILHNGATVAAPYLILLDLNMPRMNGLELLAKLRQDPQLSSSVVFVFTTSQDAQDKLAAYKLNVAGYIFKQRKSDGFIRVMDMLNHYCNVVELPAPL